MAELQFPSPQLADEVVLLRPWRETDVPAKLMAFSDPVVRRFSWPHTTPYTETDARTYFVEQEQARQPGEELNFAFVDPDDDDVMVGRRVAVRRRPAPQACRSRLLGCGRGSPAGHSEPCRPAHRRDTLVFGLLPGDAR